MVYTISDRINITSDEESGEKPSVWKQILLAFIVSLPFFTHGVETTELSASAHTGHFISSSGAVPWSTTSLIVAAAISAPVFCYMVDKWGRRSGVYLLNLAQGASCVPLFLPQTEITNITLHILAGVSTGGIFTVLPAYIREISDTRIRGVTLTLSMLMTVAGYLIYMVMGLETTMFLMVGLVVTQFLSMLVLVESPSYLVRVGKTELAKRTIAKLQCVPDDNPSVSKELDSLEAESKRAKSKENLTLWRIIKNPIYRDITKIGIILNTTMALGGSIVFLDQDKALMQLKMNLDATKSLVLACLASGCLVTVIVIKFIERKYLMTAAYSVMVLSLGVLAVYNQEDLTVKNLRWIPVVSLGILVFAYGVIWGLPAVIMVEMLNIEIRSRIISLLFVYTQIMKLIHVHTFYIVEQYMGIYTALYVFAMVNMFGAVYAIIIMPNIKDKDVRQIEKQMKRIPLLKFKTTQT